ncbi:hypothetical protein B566_EDAN012640 [Ephemera danica]|nr:hypothetical protein B566_EDAN012640 [Ephemera danica]
MCSYIFISNSKMPVDLYYIPGSAPCRSVMLAARALGVELNLKMTNLMAGEHLKPEFLKLNPQHCVPTIDDNGFALWESRAICSYLANKYGKDDSLYPKDPQKRALVDSRLYFDQGTLYQRFGDLYYPAIFGGAPLDDGKKKKLEEALEFLDKFLDGQEWVAGNDLTIADISLVASVTTVDIVGFDLSKYNNITSWLARAKSSISGYSELNEPGLEMFREMYEKGVKK